MAINCRFSDLKKKSPSTMKSTATITISENKIRMIVDWWFTFCDEVCSVVDQFVVNEWFVYCNIYYTWKKYTSLVIFVKKKHNFDTKCFVEMHSMTIFSTFVTFNRYRFFPILSRLLGLQFWKSVFVMLKQHFLHAKLRQNTRFYVFETAQVRIHMI